MKNLIIMAVFVLFLGVASAHDFEYKEKYSETYYFDGDLRATSKTVWVEYDNEDRFSTRDYRHGYSYRSTGDYFERKYSDVIYKKKSYASYDKKSWKSYSYRHYHDSGYRYYYDYVPHLRDYEKRGCYVTPPKDKLFYVKC